MAEPSPNRELADVLVREWWESFPRDARPVGSFIGMVKIVQRSLDAGWDADRLRRTLAHKVRAPRTPTSQLLAERYAAMTANDHAREGARPRARTWRDLSDPELAERWTSIATEVATEEIMQAVHEGRAMPWPSERWPFFVRGAVAAAQVTEEAQR